MKTIQKVANNTVVLDLKYLQSQIYYTFNLIKTINFLSINFLVHIVYISLTNFYSQIFLSFFSSKDNFSVSCD